RILQTTSSTLGAPTGGATNGPPTPDEGAGAEDWVLAVWAGSSFGNGGANTGLGLSARVWFFAQSTPSLLQAKVPTASEFFTPKLARTITPIAAALILQGKLFGGLLSALAVAGGSGRGEGISTAAVGGTSSANGSFVDGCEAFLRSIG